MGFKSSCELIHSINSLIKYGTSMGLGGTRLSFPVFKLPITTCESLNFPAMSELFRVPLVIFS